MTLPRTVADVLSGHVTFELECIDRRHLNVYVPQLQYATGLVSHIHRQLGEPMASTAALARSARRSPGRRGPLRLAAGSRGWICR